MNDFVPYEQRMRSYISSKTQNLRAVRSRSSICTLFVWVIAIVLWLTDQISGGETLVLNLVAVAWASISIALANLHIDSLVALKAELDRDVANGLEGFHTS